MNPEVEVKPTKMTRFLCQELLYEYVSGGLDMRRAADMEKFLPTCRDSQRELDHLMRGLAYLERASEAHVSVALHEALESFEPHWQKTAREWTLWSSRRGWQVLPYVFAAATVISGIVALKPWQHFGRQEMVLAERQNIESISAGEEAPTVPEPASAPVKAEGPALVPDLNAPAPTPELPALRVPVVETAPTPKPAAKPPPSESVAARTAREEETVVERQEESAGTRGLVSRGTMEISGFADAWPAIKDKIVALGGKAAGNVELGWLRTPKESYFHFSIPESNMGELELFLGTFGPVRFKAEKHPRVMPEGQLRIILLVKDGGPEEPEPPAVDDANESPAETP